MERSELIGVAKDEPNTLVFKSKKGRVYGYPVFEVQGQKVAACWSSGFDYELGETDPEKLDELYNEIDYFSDAIHFCEECGTAHDLDDSYHPSFKVIDCEVYCNDCVNAEDLLTEVNEPEDLFKARRLDGVAEPEGFEEVETLFCDSSGFGGPNEPALTRKQALNRTEELLEAHGSLYAAITDVGQFQVYVSFFRKLD